MCSLSLPLLLSQYYYSTFFPLFYSVSKYLFGKLKLWIVLFTENITHLFWWVRMMRYTFTITCRWTVWMVEYDFQQRKCTNKQICPCKKKKIQRLKNSVLQLLRFFHLSFQVVLFWWLFSCETTGADAEIMKYWKPQTTEMSVTGNGHPSPVC